MLYTCVHMYIHTYIHIIYTYVTAPGKTALIYTNTLVDIMAPISSSVAMWYPKPVSFIEFLMDFYIYDDIIEYRYNKDYR